MDTGTFCKICGKYLASNTPETWCNCKNTECFWCGEEMTRLEEIEHDCNILWEINHEL